MKDNYEVLFPDNRKLEKDKDVIRQAQLIMLRILKVVDHICKKHNINYWLDGGTLLGAVRHKGFIPWDDDIDLAMMRDDYDRFIEIAKDALPEDMFLQTRSSDEYYNITAQAKIRDTKSLFIEKFELNNKNENIHSGIFVDIFIYDHLPEEKIKRKLFKYFGKKLCKLQRAKLAPERKYTSDLQYKILHNLFSLKVLNRWIDTLIAKTNRSNKKIIGFGLDSNLKRVYLKEKFFPLSKTEFEGSSFPAPKNQDYYLSTTYGDYMTLPPLEQQQPKHSATLIPDNT
jgi:lipopolysaccharide cholinephosphotransferase